MVKEDKRNPREKIIELVPRCLTIENLTFNFTNMEVKLISPQLQGTSKYLCTYPHYSDSAQKKPLSFPILTPPAVFLRLSSFSVFSNVPLTTDSFLSTQRDTKVSQ